MALSQYSHQVPTKCVVYAWPSHNTVTRSPQVVLFMHCLITIQSPGPHKVCCLCMALSQYSHQVPTRCVVYAWPSHNTVTRSPQGVLFMHGPLTIQSPGPHKVCCLCMALSQYSHQVPTSCVVYALPYYNTVTRSPQGVLFMHGPLTIQSPGPHKVCCLCNSPLTIQSPGHHKVCCLCNSPLTIQSPGPHKVCCLCMTLSQYSHQVPTRCVVYAWSSHNTVTRSPQGVLFMHGPLRIQSPGPHKVCCLCMALSQYSHQVPTRCVVYAWPSHNTVTRSSQGVLFMHDSLTIQSPGPHKVCCLCMVLSQYSHQVTTRCVVYAWPSQNTVTRSPQGVLFMHGPLTIQSPGHHKVCCLCMALSQYSHQVPTKCVVYAWPSHNTVTRSPQVVLFMHCLITIQSPGPHKVCCLCMALSQYSHQVPTRCVVYAWPSHNTVTRSPQGVLFMHGPLTIQSPGPHKLCCLCIAFLQYSHQVPTSCVVYAWPSYNTVTRSPQGVLFIHGSLTIQSPGPHKLCCLCMAFSQYSHQVPTRCVVYTWPSYNTVTRSPQGVLFMHGPLTIQAPGPHKLCCLYMALLQYSHQVPTKCVVYAWPSYNTVTRSPQGVLFMHGPLTIQSPGPHKVCCLCMALLQYSHQVPTSCVVYAWLSYNTVTRSPQGVLFMHCPRPLTIVTRSPQVVLFMHGPLTIQSPGPHKLCCLCIALLQYSHQVPTRCVVYAWPSHNTVTRSPQGVLFMHGPLTIQSPGPHKVCCLCMALSQYSHQVPTSCVVYALPSYNTVTRSPQVVLFMHGPLTIQSPGHHKVCCLYMALLQYSHQVPTSCVVYAWPSHNTVTRSPQGVLFIHGPLTIQSPGPHKVCCLCMALLQYRHLVPTSCVVYTWPSYNTVTRSPQSVLFMHGPLTIQSPDPHKVCCLCMALSQYSHPVPTRCVVYAWPSYNTGTWSPQVVLFIHGPLTIQSPGPHKVCCLCMALLQYSHQIPTRCVVYAWPSHNTVTRSPQGVLFMHGPLTIQSPGPHKVCCLCMALLQYSHQVPTRCVVYAWLSYNTVTRSPQGVLFMHGPLTIQSPGPHKVCCLFMALSQYSHQVPTRCVVYAWPSYNTVTRSPQGVLFMHGPLTIQSPGPHKVCCLCMSLSQYSHQVLTRCVVYSLPSYNTVTRSPQGVLFMHLPLTIQSPGPHKVCCLCMALSQYSHPVLTSCVVYAWPSHNTVTRSPQGVLFMHGPLTIQSPGPHKVCCLCMALLQYSHQVTTRCVVYAWPSHNTVTRSPQGVLFMHGPLTIQSPGPHKVCCLCMALSQYSHQVPTRCVVYAWPSYNTVTRSSQGVLFMHGPLTIQSPGPHKVCCLCMALSQYSHQVLTRCVVYAWPSYNTVTRSPQGVLFMHGPLTIQSPGPHKVCCLCMALSQYSHQVPTRCVVYAWPSHNTVTRSPQGVLFMHGPLTIQSPGHHKVCCLCMALLQ